MDRPLELKEEEEEEEIRLRREGDLRGLSGLVSFGFVYWRMESSLASCCRNLLLRLRRTVSPRFIAASSGPLKATGGAKSHPCPSPRGRRGGDAPSLTRSSPAFRINAYVASTYELIRRE
ncbi:hypothetical protein NL676_025141 [Syzygium grande]|nr:hypothetical protein NL676_025141 [Syzygium grande]